MGFWDIHCHLMPGVDDGAADEGEMALMLRAAVEGGTEALVVTPHVDLELEHVEPSQVRGFVERSSSSLPGEMAGISLYPGAELRLNWGLLELARGDEGALAAWSIAGSGKYLLLDLPALVVPDALKEAVFRIRLSGMVPVLAHPERHPGLRSDQLVQDLLEAGVLFQVNGGSLTGLHGEEARRRAERMLRERSAAVIASDAHSAGVRRPDLGEAFRRVKYLAGEAEARRLMEENPRKIVMGERLTVPGIPDSRAVGKRRWWFRR